ncbi:MAG: AraC family transcriptional regulator [Lachnospiraceae bacterium]|nr:AraC family transcriptional regulator [Lachnospiraceae bacterium]
MTIQELATEDKKTLDLFSANYDHVGRQQMHGNREHVYFSGKSAVRVWYNNVTTNYPLHWHKSLEIIMPLTNYYCVEANDKQYNVKAGEILFVTPGTLHSCTAPDSGTRFVFMFNLTELENLNGFARIQPMFAEPFLITRVEYPNIYDDIYRVLLKIKDEYFLQSKHELYELTIHSLILEMLTLLGYDWLKKEDGIQNVTPVNKKYTQLFNNLLQYIETHYAEDLSLDNMAEKMGFSKFHFSRLFKDYTGYTFCDYVNFRRIKAAETMLENPQISITEVAITTGFTSIPTFNRLFKKYKGCTPTAFREKCSAHIFRRQSKS